MSLDPHLPDVVVDSERVPALGVLVVEDDAMIGIHLAEMPEFMGYDVCAIAATEDDAVANAVRHRPDLMIVDEHLRKGSGIWAADRILPSRQVSYVFISAACKGSGT